MIVQLLLDLSISLGPSIFNPLNGTRKGSVEYRLERIPDENETTFFRANQKKQLLPLYTPFPNSLIRAEHGFGKNESEFWPEYSNRYKWTISREET